MASIHISDNPQALAQATAEFTFKLAKDSIRRRGRCALALSGGSTPRLTYEYMRRAEGQPDWSRMYFFWSDERCVPADHPESNYRLAHKMLLAHVPVHPTHIQRMDCSPSPEAGAKKYEARLREWIRTNGEPSFDLVMLGLGQDGHTASLFPGTLALEEENHLVAANWVEKLDAWRLTLTLPALNSAAAVAFLVEGSGKASIVRAALAGPPARLPAQRVSPEHGDLHWFLDRAAAADLPPGLAGSDQLE